MITTVTAAFLGPLGAYPGIVIANFAMIQSIFGISSVNGPGWSVPFELFFPLVALLFWRHYVENAKVILFIALVASAAGVYLVSVGTDILQLRAAGGLGIGFALYRVCGIDNKTASGALPSVSAFAAVILIMATAGNVPLISIMFPLMASVTVLLGRYSRSIFSLAPFQALGRWSYGIYLTHVPIVFAFRKISESPNLDSRISVKLAIILTILSVSAFLYYFLERPMIARGYRHKITAN